MKEITIINNGVIANTFTVEDGEARRLALSIANRGTHHVRDYFDTVIGCDYRDNEVMIVKIRKAEVAS